MNKDELWLIYCKKNPEFLDDKAPITFTGRGLKKFFDQTYDIGLREGGRRADSAKSMFDRVFRTNR